MKGSQRRAKRLEGADERNALQVIGLTAAAELLLLWAGAAVGADEGVVRVDGEDLDACVDAASCTASGSASRWSELQG